MKVLVATRESQGAAEGDFCWTVEGELVLPALAECCSPDRCGCGRSFQGLASHRATTTARVADLPHLSMEAYVSLVQEALDASLGPGGPPDEVDEVVEEVAVITSSFPVGTILGREGDDVHDRGFTVTPPS